MAYYDIGFKLQHDCPFNRLTVAYPSIALAWWSNFDQNVLEASGVAPEDLAGYQSGLESAIAEMGGNIVRRTLGKSRIQLVVTWDGSKWEYSITRIFMKNNCLVLQPTIHVGGRECYRVISFAERDVKKLFKELDSFGEVEITSMRTVEEGAVRDTFTITAPALLGKLTQNQVDALKLALDSGYYAVPKKMTTEAVAARVGLPRTTFEDRLRRAESKVLQSVAPYMQLFSMRSKRNGDPASTASAKANREHRDLDRGMALIQDEPQRATSMDFQRDLPEPPTMYAPPASIPTKRGSKKGLNDS
jgi:predicted DNA binding protein